jgi:hypothetical protein
MVKSESNLYKVIRSQLGKTFFGRQTYETHPMLSYRTGLYFDAKVVEYCRSIAIFKSSTDIILRCLDRIQRANEYVLPHLFLEVLYLFSLHVHGSRSSVAFALSKCISSVAVHFNVR